MWSHRFSSDEVIVQHLAFAESTAKRTKEAVSGRYDIKYGDRPRMKLDIFGEDLANG